MIEVNGSDVSMVRGDTETLTVTPFNVGVSGLKSYVYDGTLAWL